MIAGTRTILPVAAATLIGLLAVDVATAVDRLTAGAFTEASNDVRTEIVEESSEIRTIRSRGVREVWTWDRRTLCYTEPGHYLYVGNQPSQTKVNPREIVLALYKRFRITPDGERTFLEARCRPVPQAAAPSTPRPATPTTLTTRVEDWLKVPQPTLGLSAQGTLERPGLTGAELRLWAEGVGLWAPPPTTLDNTRVEVQAWPVEYRWSMGDGTSPIVVACPANQAEPAVAGACAGSAGQPHAVHVFETKSSVGAPDGSAYTVGLQVVWRARYRAVDGDSPGPWTALPDRLTETSRPFLVEEVRAALVTD